MPVQPISRVLYGAFRKRNARDGHSSATPVARRLKQPTRMTGPDRPAAEATRHSYSVLLPVGFTVPSALPQTRCALTAPFHPCRGKTQRTAAVCFSVALSLGRSRLRGSEPAGRYPAPFVRGARTFLPRTLSSLARAAVQPTDIKGMGREGVGVKAGTGLRPGRPALSWAPCGAASGNRSAPGASSMSMNRPHRRRAPAGNAVEKP